MSKRMVANRVFVGYPWRTYRAHWESIISKLHERSPLHFMAIGRTAGQPAAQLLGSILGAIDLSTAAFFDASAANPNVALEYGYARSALAEGNIYLFLDENATSSSSLGASIISDLAGTISNRYALNDDRLSRTISDIAKQHPYNKRFDRFCGQRRYKGGTRRFLVRLIRQLDGKESMARRELIDIVAHESRKSVDFVSEYLKELHNAGLVSISRGNKYSSRVEISA